MAALLEFLYGLFWTQIYLIGLGVATLTWLVPAIFIVRRFV